MNFVYFLSCLLNCQKEFRDGNFLLKENFLEFRNAKIENNEVLMSHV